MRVYLYKLSNKSHSLSYLLSKSCQEYVNKYKGDNSAHSAGYCLANYALKDAGFVENTPVEFGWKDSGKPFFAGANCSISISHSDDIVLACASDKSVGVDIECKKELPLLYAKHLLSDEELSKYESLNNHKQKNNFLIERWCLKEAYLKCKGNGNIFNFDKINLQQDDDIYFIGKDWFGKIIKSRYGTIAIGSVDLDNINKIKIEKVTHKKLCDLVGGK